MKSGIFNYEGSVFLFGRWRGSSGNSFFDSFFDADAWIRFVTVQQGEETRKTSIRNMPGMKECWRYKWLA